MAKVTKRVDTVSLFNMKDGDIAEVVKWYDSLVPVGTVIQRYGEAVVLIGEAKGKCYPLIFDLECDYLEYKYLRYIEVRILPKGTVITL